MKKLIGIIIAIILLMPQQALCLRPAAYIESHARKPNLIKCVDLWQNSRVIEIARDLEENGVDKKFKRIKESKVPDRFTQSKGYAGCFKHKNGLQIVRRRKHFLSEPKAVKELSAARYPESCPIFLFNWGIYYFELNLGCLGYQDLAEFVTEDMKDTIEDVRIFISEFISRNLRQGDKLFDHGHLSPRNILALLDDEGNLMDIKIRDWKYFTEFNLSYYPDLVRFIKGERKDLVDADLTLAPMDGFNLRGIDLREALLQDTLLTWADFREANLEKAVLFSSDLRGADLRGANLKDANLEAANLTYADFRGAVLLNTRFSAFYGKRFEAEGFHVVYDEDICMVTNKELLTEAGRLAFDAIAAIAAAA